VQKENMPDREDGGSVRVGAMGELLVEFVAAQKDTRHLAPADYRGPFPSGAPGIFIDQAARMGAKTIFAGAVGDGAHVSNGNEADALGEERPREGSLQGGDEVLVGPTEELP
jgi:hypothetical protein